MGRETDSKYIGERRVLSGIAALHGLLVLVVLVEYLGIELLIMRPLIITIYLTFIPGILLLQFFPLEGHSPIVVCLYAIGMSLLTIMLLGVFMSLLYPAIGIEEPLTEYWLTATLTALVGCWLLIVRRYSIPVGFSIPDMRLFSPTPLLLLHLPLLSIISVFILNEYDVVLPLVLLLIGISVIPIIVSRKKIESRWFPLAVWAIALALLYHHSLWEKAYPIEMWTITDQDGRWMPVLGGVEEAVPMIMGAGQESILPDSVLFPIYAALSDIPLMTQLTVINPLFVTLIPLATFELCKRYIDAQDAFFVTCLIMFSFRFYIQHFPNAPRDVTATIFFVFLGLVIADNKLPRPYKMCLGFSFIIGITVSHYGTSYILIGTLVIAVITKIILDKENYLHRTIKFFSPDVPLSRNIESTQKSDSNDHIITIPLVAFFIVIVSLWYGYTAGGTKFLLLVNSFRNLTTIGLNFFGESTEILSLERSFTIDVILNIYLVIGLLMGIGITLITIDRIITGSTTINDDHLAISIGLMGVLASTFLPVGLGFDTGRVLMIILPFTALFSVVAIYRIRDLVSRAFAWASSVKFSISDESIQVIIAVALSIFLLLNAGVVSELVTNDYAPSPVVNENRLQESENEVHQWRALGCVDCEIESHVWLLDHGNRNADVYSGEVETRNWYWYSETIVSEVDGFVPEILLTNASIINEHNLWDSRNNIPPNSYIRLNEENRDPGWVTAPDREPHPIDSVEPQLEESDKIYSNQHSEVYITN